MMLIMILMMYSFSLQSNVVESGVAADQKARTTSSKVIHINI